MEDNFTIKNIYHGIVIFHFLNILFPVSKTWQNILESIWICSYKDF